MRPVTLLPSVGRDDDGRVLIADLLARLDDRFQQVAHAEAAGDDRSGPAPGRRPRCRSGGRRSSWPRRTAAGRGRSRAWLQPFLHDRRQLVELPLLDERPRLADDRRGGRGHRHPRIGLQLRLSPWRSSVATASSFIMFRKPLKAGAALEVGGLQEPGEVLAALRQASSRSSGRAATWRTPSALPASAPRPSASASWPRRPALPGRRAAGTARRSARGPWPGNAGRSGR